MKILNLCTLMMLSGFAMPLWADSVQDQYSMLIQRQETYEKFQENYNEILDDIEMLTERGHQTKDRSVVYPMCVAMQSVVTLLKNNQSFKPHYDRDYKQFDTSYDQTLAQVTNGLVSQKKICNEAREEYRSQSPDI